MRRAVYGNQCGKAVRFTAPVGRVCYFVISMDRVRKQLGIHRIVEKKEKISPVTVAVLDSGIDAGHPDLEGKVLDFRDFINNRKKPYDDFGHGTHVCGCIVGSGKASEGLYRGIVPECNLLVGKILDKKGDGSVKMMAEALKWIMERKDIYNIRVLNISIGTGRGYENRDYAEVRELLDEAWYQGLMIVCAAGNSGPEEKSISLIGRDRNIITVGCHEGGETYRFGRPCQIYSGRGEKSNIYRKPDIVAPGTEIVSCKAYPYRKRRPTERYYCKKSGTSMATAIVSGCCALFFERNEKESNEYCKRRLIQTAKDLGEPWNKQGYGMVEPEEMIRI